MKDRVDVHNHTFYSSIRLIDALTSPKDLIDRAIEIGLKGVAITDHELVASHVKALKYMEEVKKEHPDFKLILGNEIYLTDVRPAKFHPHFILLAKDTIGHHQLKELSSIAWINSYSSRGLERVDTLKSDLEKVVKKNPGHLIASTACLGGEISKLILALNKAEFVGAEELRVQAHNKIVDFVLWCKELFGDDFYFECQPGTSEEQIIVNKRMIALSKAFGVKMIATSDSHFLRKEDRSIHKSFLNSKEGEREVDAFYSACFLHDEEQMVEGLRASEFSYELIEQMFDNSMEIYNKIEGYDLFRPQQIPTVHVKDYPKKKVPVEFKNCKVISDMYESDDIYDRFWVNECYKGLDEKVKDWRNKRVYIDELEEEAEIKKTVGDRLGTNMFRYPILLQHYIGMIWESGSVVGAGRGSACAALNHYVLGLNQLDPIEWNFPMWRYMNRETTGLGDVDIDVAPSKRPIFLEKVRQERKTYFDDSIDPEIREKLGAVFVGTYAKETAKSAVAVACRGYRDEKGEAIDSDVALYLSSLIPVERGFVWSLHDVVYGDPDKHRRPVMTFVNEVKKYDGLLDIMLGIENVISRRGIHASGVIMFEDNPFERCAFMKAPNGEITTQFDLGDCEALGMTKLDILLTDVVEKITLTINLLQEYGYIEKELSLREAYDKYVHPDAIDLNSKETWDAIKKLQTIGLFQFDTQVGGAGVKKLQPSTVQELSNVNALIRLMSDGDNESPIEHYARLKSNSINWEREMNFYKLNEEEKDMIKPYLESSYGLGLSQEQLMRVLLDEKMFGFDLTEVNAIRKIVSKKKMSQIPQLRERIMTGCKSEHLASYVWDSVVSPQLG